MNPILLALVCDGIRVVQILPARNPDWSVAILTTETGTVFRKRGGEIDGRTVVDVQREGVLLRRGDLFCRVGTVAPDVVRLPERKIARAEASRIFEKVSNMRRSPLLPEKGSDGIVRGRLHGIRPGEGLALFGFENGDLFQSVNGFDISAPDKALEAYARLRTADHFVLRVIRRGVPADIELAIE